MEELTMSKYLIEVPHEGDKESCMRAIRVFKETGSHFLSHAEWGCTDGEHKAWMIVEIDSKEAAKKILPAAYKMNAKITRLSQFSQFNTAERVLDLHS
jgi:hypothetical protein